MNVFQAPLIGPEFCTQYCFTLIGHCVFWIGTKRNLLIKHRRHVGNERLVRRKYVRHYFSNSKSSGCITESVGNLNCRSRKSAQGQRRDCGVDWLGAYEQGIATGARDSIAIPTARAQDTNALCRSVISELMSHSYAHPHRYACTIWRIA